MLSKTKQFLSERRTATVSLGFVFVILLGLIDFWSGPQIGFSIFYLFPILAATWLSGAGVGITLSVLSAAAWLAADLMWDSSYTHPLIPCWNAIMRLGMFLIAAILLSRYRQLNLGLERIVKDRTASLEKEIAERKRMEDNLRTSEKNYRDLVENAIVGVYKTNLAGDILYANKALATMFEFSSPEEMMATNVLLIYKNTDDRRRLLEILNDAGFVRNFEVDVLTKTGATKRVILSALLEDGTISGMIRDISEMKILEDQLQQAQRMESLGTLAGGIAHDFNNILGIISGHSALMARLKRLPDNVSRSVHAIAKVTERGAALVKQLLTFARKSEAIFQSFHVNDLINEIKTLLEETLPKTILISTQLQKDLPPIVADISQIHQVLLNLCVNARDAMPKGGTLSICTSTIEGQALLARFPTAESREYVQIQVSDTGSGMDESTQQRIFDPFFTTKEHGKGTGLGLALVYSVVEHHKGFIDVASEIGRGSTFTVYLPIDKPAAESVNTSKPPTREVVGGTETILIVEDEEMLRELEKTILASAGYTVLVAQDGKEAIETFMRHQHEIACVVCDLGLPKVSGEEVFRRIRAIRADARVMIASGMIDADTKSELYKAGMRYFITKPYSYDDLLQRVRDIIDIAP